MASPSATSPPTDTNIATAPNETEESSTISPATASSTAMKVAPIPTDAPKEEQPEKAFANAQLEDAPTSIEPVSTFNNPDPAPIPFESISPPKPETEAIAPAATTTTSTPDSTMLNITLMLTTGARHPYKIDEKYLRSRKADAVNSEGRFDPRELSGYKLKELIWTDWRAEWEPRPASPSSIRLICMGRMLEDKKPLKDFAFKLNDINVLHMTVKPADFLDDDEAHAGTAKGHHAVRPRDAGDSHTGCRCVIL